MVYYLYTCQLKNSLMNPTEIFILKLDIKVIVCAVKSWKKEYTPLCSPIKYLKTQDPFISLSYPGKYN